MICLQKFALTSAEDAQKLFVANYNQVSESGDEAKANHYAWDVHQQFEQDESGVWSKSKMTV